jgi:hypothetical protein
MNISIHDDFDRYLLRGCSEWVESVSRYSTPTGAVGVRFNSRSGGNRAAAR